MGSKSNILKIALFATGLSGIVAEYVLSTLATYFLGDSVFQWTITVSLMLFAMGIGSLLSQKIKSNLLEKFLVIEFILSVLSAYSAILTYTVSAYTLYLAPIIYGLSIMIGVLIGLEIPLVIRINETYDSLRENIAGVMAMDYIGSLAGGLFFAFVGIPYLGMSYTPQLLGSINFIVAIMLFVRLRKLIVFRRPMLKVGAGIAGLFLIVGVIVAEPVLLYGEQARYKEKVIHQERSKYQKIVLTQWKDVYWLFINGNQQLSTIDEWFYHETIVHPVMQLNEGAENVLILGGGDGCAVRELLKYDRVKNITVVDLDPAMTNLSRSHPVLKKLNGGALDNKKVEIINADGFSYLDHSNDFYDVIIIDLPDPKTIDIARLYSKEFYQLVRYHLRPNGYMITQAASPQFAYLAFKCIDKTMSEAGFTTLPMHVQIMTLGEWGFVIGQKVAKKEDLLKRSREIDFKNVKTRFLNNEAMLLTTSFGKNIKDSIPVKINTRGNPVLQRYYLKGDWQIY